MDFSFVILPINIGKWKHYPKFKVQRRKILIYVLLGRKQYNEKSSSTSYGRTTLVTASQILTDELLDNFNDKDILIG